MTKIKSWRCGFFRAGCAGDGAARIVRRPPTSIPACAHPSGKSLYSRKTITWHGAPGARGAAGMTPVRSGVFAVTALVPPSGLATNPAAVVGGDACGTVPAAARLRAALGPPFVVTEP